MGYRNLNSGSIRQQRRQQSRLSTQAPVGGSSVGHGSGLRFYDGGELVIDGLNTGMRFWIQEIGGGNSVARLQFTFEDMTNIASQPAVWSQATTNSLILAGPLNYDSTAGEGYGGSNLFLNGDRASLVAGEGGNSFARLNLWDNGSAYLRTLNAQLSMNEDGTHGLVNDDGQGYWLNSEGGAYVVGRRARLNLQEGGHVGLSGLNGSLYINEDGSHSLNDGNGRGFWTNSEGGAYVIGRRARLDLQDNGHAQIIGHNGELYINVDGSLGLNDGKGRGFWVNDSGVASVQGRNAVYLGTGDGGAGYNSHSDGRFYIGSSGNAIIQGESNGALNMWAPNGGQFNGDFAVAGEKNFIMDHPNKPGYTIKYASTESPVSGIEDRGRVTIGDDGTADIVLPEHFTAIVKPDTDVDIILQPYGPGDTWCEPPTHEGTTVHGEPGTVVAWRAFAQRIAKGFKVVEKGSVSAPPEPEEGDQ